MDYVYQGTDKTNFYLNYAKQAGADEFYTRLVDIENELRHYPGLFSGKTVYCNCDDPYKSNFFRYFVLHFNALKLKSLIATCRADRQMLLPLFPGDSSRPLQKAYRAEINAVPSSLPSSSDTPLVDILTRDSRNSLSLLAGDGDFRSPECVALLQQADIIVTNPPFSLFREYFDILARFHKKFLIMGNENIATAAGIFPFIKNNQLWLGPSLKNGDISFYIPDSYSVRNPAALRTEKETGRRMLRVRSVRWYTNVDNAPRPAPMPLVCTYSPAAYPPLDNYPAISVSASSDIPADFPGLISVPITFLDKWCPDQFEIVDCLSGSQSKYPFLHGTALYSRLIIRNKHPRPASHSYSSPHSFPSPFVRSHILTLPV